MPVRNYKDLFAWQAADAFCAEVIRLVRASPEACRDHRFRDQLTDAALAVPSDIAEGFLRRSPAEFCRFLKYGLGSLAEAEGRLRAGIALGYFSAEDCQPAFRHGRRCLTASIRLKRSQERYQATRDTSDRAGRRPTPRRRR